MIAIATERARLLKALQEFSALCVEVESLAASALHVENVGSPEREFVASLLRNAKGGRAAAAAWRQELNNR